MTKKTTVETIKKTPAPKWHTNKGVHLIEFPETQHLAEIYRSGYQFALVNAIGQICCAWCYCKDFLSDAIWGTLFNKPVSIYSFTYDPKKHPPLDMETLRIAIRDTNKNQTEFDNMMKSLIEFMNQIEDTMGIKRSILLPVLSTSGKDVSSTYYIESSKRWLRAPALFSLYTLLIRAGTAHKIGTSWEKTITDLASSKLVAYREDNNYTAKSKNNIIALIKSKGEAFSRTLKNNWNETATTNIVHNNSGIVALSSAGYCFPVRENKQIEKYGLTSTSKNIKPPYSSIDSAQVYDFTFKPKAASK